MSKDNFSHSKTLLTFAAAMLTLSACGSERSALDEADGQSPAPSEIETPSPDNPVSILRPEVEQPDLPEIPLEPLEVTVGFPDGGAELDAAALLVLQEVLASDQLSQGGPITLRSHSDSDGSDESNMRASLARGERIKAWLMENEVAEDRISVIAFGEQNPIEPNAMPDGSANEDGRAANRRVDIEVLPPLVDTPDASAAGE